MRFPTLENINIRLKDLKAKPIKTEEDVIKMNELEELKFQYNKKFDIIMPDNTTNTVCMDAERFKAELEFVNSKTYPVFWIEGYKQFLKKQNGQS